MTPRRFLMTSAFLWCAAIVATPILASYDGAPAKLASLSYDIFSRICNQLDSHSFHFAGFKFAVCIRCTAIYTSFFLGLLFFPMIKQMKIAGLHPARLLILSLAPMGIDVSLAILGIHESTTLTRAATGLIFGLALAIVLVPVLEDFVGRFLLLVHRLAADHNLRNLQSALNPRNLSSGHHLRNLPSALNLRNLSNQPRIHHATKAR